MPYFLVYVVKVLPLVEDDHTCTVDVTIFSAFLLQALWLCTQVVSFRSTAERWTLDHRVALVHDFVKYAATRKRNTQ